MNTEGGSKIEKFPLPLSWRVWDIFINSDNKVIRIYIYVNRSFVNINSIVQISLVVLLNISL
jgi:hypothetical protein